MPTLAVHSRACLMLLLTTCTSVGLSRRAAADDAKEARAHVAAAGRLERKKDYAGAAVELRAALSLRPDARTQLALATTLRRADDIEGALTEARKAEGDASSASVSKSAGQLRKELEAQLGTIAIAVTPDAADVSIDARPVGQTPVSIPLYKRPGAHVVKVEKPGYVTLERSVEVVAGQATPPVVGSLVLAPVPVVVRTDPVVRDSILLVDDEERGPLPWSGDLVPGSHSFTARSATFTIVSQRAEDAPLAPVGLGGAAPTAPLSAEIVLSAEPRLVRLRVKTIPSQARVLVDGVMRGTGTIDVGVPVGPHPIRVEATGYRAFERVVGGTSDENVSVDLEPASVKPTAKARATHGLFAELTGVGLFTVASDPVIDCARADVTSCSSSGGPFGGGFDMHYGYVRGGSWGSLGLDVELMLLSGAAGMSRSATVRQRDGTDTDASFAFLSPMALAAAGPRYVTPGKALRGTLAIDVGAAFRGVLDPGTEVGDVRARPALSFALGGIYGRSSGTHFGFGAKAFLEFPWASNPGTALGVPVQFGTTTMFTLGPYLGVFFGP